MYPRCRVRHLPRIGFVESTGLRFAQERRRCAVTQRYPQSTGRPMPIANGLLTERAADYGLRCWWQQRPLRARLPLDRVNLAQREGRVYRRCGSSTRQDVVKIPRDCRTSLARMTKTRSQAAITVRVCVQPCLIVLSACAKVRPPSRCADRRPSLLSSRSSAAKRDIHPRCRDRSGSCLPSCKP